MFESFIFLLLPLFFFHLVQNSASDLNHDEVLKSLRPLKYSTSYTESCTEFCGNIACQPIKECEEGVIVKKNETYCGCCEACVKYLDTDDSCTDIIKGTLALGAQPRCKTGTTCKNARCELIVTKSPLENKESNDCNTSSIDNSLSRQNPSIFTVSMLPPPPLAPTTTVSDTRRHTEQKSCLRHVNIIQEHVKTGNYESDLWIPQCDEEGYYKAKQEKITRSICVDKSGKKIFGNANDLLDNTCACSRLIQDKIVKESLSFYVKPHEHCSSSGSFDALQCVGNLCYCADVNTGDIKSDLVRIDFLQNLDCFKEKIHPEGYLKDCEKELQRTKKLAYEFWKKGVKIHGIDRVACDPDGTFSPKQCLPDRCICTDEKGEGIRQYGAELAKAKNFSMSCYCARDDNSAHFQTLSCEDYGNYKPYTCFGDNCVCVDEDGESIKLKTSDIMDIRSECEKLIKSLSEYPKDDKSFTDDGRGSTDDDNSFTDDYDYTDYDDDTN